MSDEYIQRPEGQSLKGGSWVYDTNGKLVSVNGVPVPPEVEVYSQEVIDSLPKKDQEEDGED